MNVVDFVSPLWPASPAYVALELAVPTLMLFVYDTVKRSAQTVEGGVTSVARCDQTGLLVYGWEAPGQVKVTVDDALSIC